MFKIIIILSVLLAMFISIVIFHGFSIYNPFSKYDFTCEGEINSKKMTVDGNVASLKTTALIIFNSADSVTTFHKGILTTAKGKFHVDRKYGLKLEKLGNSATYRVSKTEMVRSFGDDAPDGVVRQFYMDDINFLNIIQINEHLWMIHGVLLPIMMCYTE